MDISSPPEKVLTASNNIPPVVRFATPTDVEDCKIIVDSLRNCFGFIPRAAFVDAAERQRLLIASYDEKQVIGFVRFNHRVRGSETALYDIAVSPASQRQGVGGLLVAALIEDCHRIRRQTIVLRCPEDLPANNFYKKLGFELVSFEQAPRRRLHVWRLQIRDTSCNS